MAARVTSFVVWLIAAASAVLWGTRLFVAAPALPAHAEVVSAASAARADLGRLLGTEAPVAVAAAAAPPADARFRLLGVVAPRSGSAPAVALIAVGDKPPRAYRVGAVVEGDDVLQEVQARGASLGPAGGAARVSLALAQSPSRGPAGAAAWPRAGATVPPPAPASPPGAAPEVMPPMPVSAGAAEGFTAAPAAATPPVPAPAAAAAPATAAAPAASPPDDPDAEGGGRTRRPMLPRSGGALMR